MCISIQIYSRHFLELTEVFAPIFKTATLDMFTLILSLTHTFTCNILCNNKKKLQDPIDATYEANTHTCNKINSKTIKLRNVQCLSCCFANKFLFVANTIINLLEDY